MIRIIASDGNTGAARGAFDAAIRSKLRIMTKIAPGMMTDDGPLPNEYKGCLNGFYECDAVPPWLANIRGTSNVTLVLYSSPDKAEDFDNVIAICRLYGKPCVKYQIDICGDYDRQAMELRELLFAVDVADVHLNVIGSRESKSPGIQKAVSEIMTILLVADKKTYSFDPWYFQMMTGELKNYFLVPDDRRYVIPYVYRKVTECFFKEFTCSEWYAKPAWGTNIRAHRGGHFQHILKASDGFNIEIEAIVDSNERLVEFKAKVIKWIFHEIPSGIRNSNGEPIDTEIRRSFEKRTLTEQDIVMLRELLDRCTKPRAPALASLLCGTPRKLHDGTDVCIKDNYVVCKNESSIQKIPLSRFYEFLEWSYSYLEFFTFQKFVEINLPWTHECSQARAMMSILRLSDPRRIYSYGHVLGTFLDRINKIHNLYYACQGTSQDRDFLKDNKQSIQENLRKVYGKEYVECE